MECNSVDFPDPFSPCSIIKGCDKSTIIGIWKFKLTKIGWARILRYIGFSISSKTWGQTNLSPTAQLHRKTKAPRCGQIRLSPGFSYCPQPLNYTEKPRPRGVDRSVCPL